MKTYYHGTPNNFERFDYNKIGTNGTAEGFGFYFTDNIEIANNYAGENGYIKEYIPTGKGLSCQDRLLSKRDFIRLVSMLDDYYTNYNETFDSALSDMIENDYYNTDTDAEIIGNIINGSGGKEDVLKGLLALGYDYMIDNNVSWGNQTIIIKFNNELN